MSLEFSAACSLKLPDNDTFVCFFNLEAKTHLQPNVWLIVMLTPI